MPQHVRKKQEHDGRVHELVQEGAEQRRPTRVTVAVRDHPHAEHGAAPEHEAHRDEDVERVHQELERGRKNDPHLPVSTIVGKKNKRGLPVYLSTWVYGMYRQSPS